MRLSSYQVIDGVWSTPAGRNGTSASAVPGSPAEKASESRERRARINKW